MLGCVACSKYIFFGGGCFSRLTSLQIFASHLQKRKQNVRGRFSLIVICLLCLQGISLLGQRSVRLFVSSYSRNTFRDARAQLLRKDCVLDTILLPCSRPQYLLKILLEQISSLDVKASSRVAPSCRNQKLISLLRRMQALFVLSIGFRFCLAFLVQ